MLWPGTTQSAQADFVAVATALSRDFSPGARVPTMRFPPEPWFRSDLRDIEAYTLREWGEAQWESYEASLWQALESLGDNPYLGRVRSDLRLNARSLVIRQHVIVYEVNERRVSVARIIHSSRDLRAALRAEL